MSTTFRLSLSSRIILAFLFPLVLMPQLSSASPRDFFTFERFSSRLGFKVPPAQKGRNGSSSLGGGGDQYISPLLVVSAGIKQNVKAPRGVRKLLFGTLSCAPQDLSLTQGPVSSTSGIPTFNVQIVNLCGACAMADIHVACGNWASATPVDPFVFTRLGYNDCLVNNGRPLSSQGSVSFQYSNSAMYPMSIATATNQCNR